MARLRTVAATVALVVVTACGGGAPADPQQAVAEAVDATADTSFAFSLTADLQDASGDPGMAQALAVFRSARIGGVQDDEGTVSLTIEAMGLEFGEMRAFEDGTVFLRANTQAIIDMSGGLADPSALLEDLPPGLPADVRSFAEAALRGDWVGLESSLDSPTEDLDLPDDAPFSSDDAQALIDGVRERFGDLSAAVEEFATVTELEQGDSDGRRFAVDIDVEAIVRAFAEVFEEATGEPAPADEVQQAIDDLPTTLSGIQMEVVDGLVSRVTVDLAQMLAAAGESAGMPESATLTLELSDHGSVDAVARPADAVVLTQDTFQELLEDFLIPGMPGPEEVRTSPVPTEPLSTY